jgi:glycerate-2-kinase
MTVLEPHGRTAPDAWQPWRSRLALGRVHGRHNHVSDVCIPARRVRARYTRRVSFERLRADALAAFETAVAAVQPARLLPSAITTHSDHLEIAGAAVARPRGRMMVAALGKAGPTLADAWLEVAGPLPHQLFVLTPHGVPVTDRVAHRGMVRHGAHPYPDAAGEASARELVRLVRGLEAEDLLVVLLSGGTSALLAAPEAGLTLDDVLETTRALLRSGAPIGDVNAVRRELLILGGGGLARLAAPADVVTLILSDVLGDPLPDIASGPTVPSPTSKQDAADVLRRFDVSSVVPESVIAFLTRPTARGSSPADWMDRTRTVVVANNRTAVDAAAQELTQRGYSVHVEDEHLTGEASQRGRQIGRMTAAGLGAGRRAWLAGGETTVTVRGDGRGGRNQELTLAAAIEIAGAGPRVVLSGGTDGIDGLSDHAGGIVDATTVERLERADIDPSDALERNDSGTALAAAGDAIVTGPTGTNVCDITAALTAD